MSMNVIRVVSVSKSFGAHRAVDNVSLEVARGEMVALVGADGAGKTTTIRMLCGILPADKGELSVCGFDVRRQSSEVKKRIGYLSQRFSLYSDLSIDENIEFFAEIHGVTRFRERREQLLEFTRLTPFRARLAEDLSGGMKQKLALACTLIHTPEVIFLDEPTAGVDPVSRRDFWKILSDLLKTGITIFMTTPYLDEAERCSRVAMMNEGKILIDDTPQTLKATMKETLIEVVTPDIRAAFGLLKTEKVCREVQAFGDRLNVVLTNGKRGVKTVLDLLRKNSIAVSSHRIIVPSLENVFISLLSEGSVANEQLEGVAK